jgi:hypothetical protein
MGKRENGNYHYAVTKHPESSHTLCIVTYLNTQRLVTHIVTNVRIYTLED